METFPADLVGKWSVSGISYQAISTTHFLQNHGEFAAGVFVEVKYRVDDAGARVAFSIKTHIAPRQAPNTARGRFEGRETRGEDDVWHIGGREFICDPAMELNEPGSNDTPTSVATIQQGVPTIGDELVVNYYETNGMRYITYASEVQTTYLPLITN